MSEPDEPGGDAPPPGGGEGAAPPVIPARRRALIPRPALVIPDSLRVRVAGIGDAQALKTELDGAPGVDTIVIQPLPPTT